ncbi:PEP/pyruvate-binding domain-containing protein, partial [Burkholderia contaminans]|uniref:PEP/pyruvate-binding domain-containing protein n=1 Tax=Burkholderia contaminans TaxID=488447 RepID=UPI0028F40A1B
MSENIALLPGFLQIGSEDNPPLRLFLQQVAQDAPRLFASARVQAHLRNRAFFSHLGACMTNAANVAKDQAYVIPFEQLRMTDVEIVGGKNASLGEMISQLSEAGVRVPTGFATTALAFRDFLKHNDLTDRIAKR